MVPTNYATPLIKGRNLKPHPGGWQISQKSGARGGSFGSSSRAETVTRIENYWPSIMRRKESDQKVISFPHLTEGHRSFLRHSLRAFRSVETCDCCGRMGSVRNSAGSSDSKVDTVCEAERCHLSQFHLLHLHIHFEDENIVAIVVSGTSHVSGKKP